MSFILMVALLTYGSNGGNTISMQEFSTLTACENAAREAKEKLKPYSYVSLQTVCVPK